MGTAQWGTDIAATIVGRVGVEHLAPQTACFCPVFSAIVGGAEVYLSDFGGLTVMPHYLMAGSDTAYVLNSDYIDLAFLDGFKTTDLAKTGDSDKVLVTADCALAVRASAAQGKISDLSA